MRTFLARYDGPCADPSCEFPIESGYIVEFVDDQLVHEGCRPPVERAPRPICGECFQEVALNGKCGCIG